MGNQNQENKFQNFLGNALASGMLPEGAFSKRYLTLEEAKRYVDVQWPTSVVGHENTAGLFSSMLGRPVAMNRATVALNPGDELLVGEYSGPRLPEGATSLPEGAEIKWALYRVCSDAVSEQEADEMYEMIADAAWGYRDHHSGVDPDDYLEDMIKLCDKARQIIRNLFG